jgi:hypothetical protein
MMPALKQHKINQHHRSHRQRLGNLVPHEITFEEESSSEMSEILTGVNAVATSQFTSKLSALVHMRDKG